MIALTPATRLGYAEPAPAKSGVRVSHPGMVQARNAPPERVFSCLPIYGGPCGFPFGEAGLPVHRSWLARMVRPHLVSHREGRSSKPSTGDRQMSPTYTRAPERIRRASTACERARAAVAGEVRHGE